MCGRKNIRNERKKKPKEKERGKRKKEKKRKKVQCLGKYLRQKCRIDQRRTLIKNKIKGQTEVPIFKGDSHYKLLFAFLTLINGNDFMLKKKIKVI